MTIVDKVLHPGSSSNKDKSQDSQKAQEGGSNQERAPAFESQMGGLSLEQQTKQAPGQHFVQEASPIVAEHVHDQYVDIDKTRTEELREKTKVVQTVQPIRDLKTEAVQRDRVDHGVEVHEHGKAGLDERTEAELAAKREEIAKQHAPTRDEKVESREEKPAVEVTERTKIIEEVVPVVERDIYRPHEIEHHKRVVKIVHEPPVIAGTKVAEPMTAEEWEKQTGTSLKKNKEGASSSSSSSSSSEGEGIGAAAGTGTLLTGVTGKEKAKKKKKSKSSKSGKTGTEKVKEAFKG